MAVTSQATLSGKTGEVPIKNWKDAGMLKPSLIKPVITTIESSLVLRRLGQINTREQRALRTAIGVIVG
jgi:mRNA interferase MazF